MKKILYLLLASVLCCALVFTACAGSGQQGSNEPAEAEAGEAGAAETDLASMLLGAWMSADADGQPVPSNDKLLFRFDSATEASVASLNGYPETLYAWNDGVEAAVEISGSKVTLTSRPDTQTILSDEFTVTEIDAGAFTAERRTRLTGDGKEALAKEEQLRCVKVDKDHSEEIIGLWEGRCTSEGSAFDDGQDHRWEYKEDGTFVYYVQDGDGWALGENTVSDYFVAGDLLCTRWENSGAENREAWEIAIDGDVMRWSGTRQDEAGGSSVVTFEMHRVEQ
jgi:hypothetical protein